MRKKRSRDFEAWKNWQKKNPSEEDMTDEKFNAIIWKILSQLNPEQVRKLREDLPNLARRVRIESKRNQFKALRGGKADPEPLLKSKFTL